MTTRTKMRGPTEGPKSFLPKPTFAPRDDDNPVPALAFESNFLAAIPQQLRFIFRSLSTENGPTCVKKVGVLERNPPNWRSQRWVNPSDSASSPIPPDGPLIPMRWTMRYNADLGFGNACWAMPFLTFPLRLPPCFSFLDGAQRDHQ